MRKLLPAFALLIPGAAAAQAVQPGRWDVTSTITDLAVPGAPGFLLRMARGKSRTEHKCVSPAAARTGVTALLAPDPKAQCRVDSFRAEGGRYSQALTCPQKKGAPLTVSRSGTYDASGFAGRVRMAGSNSKGPVNVLLDQRATRAAPSCG